MKRILPFLVAFSVSPLAHADNAPAVAVLPPAPTANAIDPAAAALLDESAQAYAKLDGFSAHFATHDESGPRTTTMSGNIAFARPGKAKVDVNASQLDLVVETDGEKIFSQIKPKATAKVTPQMAAAAKQYQARYTDDGETLAAVLQQVPSALSVPLPLLANGNNPLGMEEVHWLTASVLPDSGVRMTAALAPGVPPLVFRIYFDPQDKLVRRVEAEMTVKGQKTVNLTTLTNVRANPEFAADAFTFAPAPDSKEVLEPPHFDPKLRIGAAPIALVGKDLQGKTHPWSEYAGKVVLLDFWATWSPPSMAEIPAIQEMLKNYHSAGFEVLGVNLDQNKTTLQAFLKQQGITFPQIFDGKFVNGADAKAYSIGGLPFALLVGKDGKIAAVNPRGSKLEPAIVKALAQ